MTERSGWLGAVAVGGLAIICCAGPLLVVGAASLGVGAWLAAHGLWLLETRPKRWPFSGADETMRRLAKPASLHQTPE